MDKQTVEDYLAEVFRECKNLNIPVSNYIDPEITINTRAKSRFAACRRQRLPGKRQDCFTIEVGQALLKAEKEAVKNTLAHELLHTCYGCYNHGTRWKQYADRMNRAYGYNIRTRTTYEELGLVPPEKKQVNRYAITCQKCGKTIYRQKRSKLVTQTGHYRCSCGGRLKCKNLT